MSLCGAEALDVEEVDSRWLNRFRTRAVSDRIPISGMIELTRRCNLRCRHCYQQADRDGELPGKAAVRIIREAAQAGTLFVTITGGEPLLHPDFDLVYRECREAGIVTGVFTNGTVLNQGHIRLFQRYPPRMVEISIYGADAITHDALTGLRGAFHRTLEAVRALVGAGINAGLKTVILNCNLGQVDAMRELAGRLGVPFRVDPLVFGVGGDAGEKMRRLRADPGAAVKAELASEAHRQEWQRYAWREGDYRGGDRLYNCGAGVTGFFITASGWLAPCAMATHRAVPLYGRNFAEAWAEVGTICKQKVSEAYKCRGCDLRPWCNSCPALAWLEVGDEQAPVLYACELARARRDLLAAGSHVRLGIG